MASDPFDFSDVFTDLENKIDGLMHEPMIHELAQRIFAESTDELVYALYTPGEYIRRGDNGGIGDYNNYEVINTGFMEMTVCNNTIGNETYANSQGWDPGYITDIIEGGFGYHWTRSQIYRMQPYPRPFMETACNRFVENSLMPMIHSRFFDD